MKFILILEKEKTMNDKNINNFIKWLEEETEEYRHYSKQTPCDDDNGGYYKIGYADACIEILGKMREVVQFEESLSD